MKFREWRNAMALIEYDEYKQKLRDLGPELQKLSAALDIDSAVRRRRAWRRRPRRTDSGTTWSGHRRFRCASSSCKTRSPASRSW